MYTRFLLLFSFCLALFACGGSGHKGHTGRTAPKTSLDSLYTSIWDAHDSVMPKMGKIRGAQKKAKQLLDSLNQAWSKRSMAEPENVKILKATLQSVLDELNYADYAMDRWMTEFNDDSAQQNGDGRRTYLESEMIKVNKVKEAIKRSLSRADSLFASVR